MANDDVDGVWRTISGRRVFIKDGQSVPDAMKKSGKFKSVKDKKEDNIDDNKADDNNDSENNSAKGKEYRQKLENLKGKEDGTYNLDSGKKVDFGNKGYNVSFEQSTDNFTDSEYYAKIVECRDKCDGNVYGGVFGGDPEISFYTTDKKVAIEIMKKYNQHSIWDNSIQDIIENPDYDKKKNPTNYK